MNIAGSVQKIRNYQIPCLISRTFYFLALFIIVPSVVSDDNLSEESAYYSGPISKEQNRQFFESVKNKAIKRLVITSGGGEVRAGIALGLWVFEQKLDIEIPEFCLSSCANYVFTAAQRKFIDKGAIVAWHGNYHHLKKTGLWRDDITIRMKRDGVDARTAGEQVLSQVNELVDLEHDFFHQINVDQYLCWIGKMPPYKAPNYYFLSRQDMARFGVSNVHTPQNYEHTDISGFDFHVIYIKLHNSGHH